MKMKPSKNKFHTPTYNDGIFEIFKIKESDDITVQTSLEDTYVKMTYRDLGISDRLRSDLDAHDINIQLKIRTADARRIVSSDNVLKIEGTYYKVYNVYHFLNNDGIQESDITLVNWSDEEYE